MIKNILLILSILSTIAHAGQCTRRDNIALANVSGFAKPASGASIRVCSQAGSLTPCTPLATVYSDQACSISIANPLASDSNGNYHYYAISGFYVEQVSTSGSTTFETRDVVIPNDPTNASFTSVVSKTIGSVRYANQFSSIKAAIDDVVAAGGGTVIVPASVTPYQITNTTKLVLGNGTAAVSLQLDKNAKILAGVTDGTCAITLDNGALINGSGTALDNFAGTVNGSLIRVADGANMSAVICAAHTDGTQVRYGLSNFYLQGDSANTSTVLAMIDLGGGSSGGYLRDLVVTDFKQKGLYIHPPITGVKIFSVMEFTNLVIDGRPGNTTASPIVIESAPLSSVSSLVFNNINAENIGTNQAGVTINGNGGDANSITFNFAHIEAGGPMGVIGFNIKDAYDITLNSVNGSDGGLDFIKLSDTGAPQTKTYSVKINSAYSNGWTNILNDTINLKVIPQNPSTQGFLANYDLFAGYHSPIQIYNVGGSKTTNFERLNFDWSANTARIFTEQGGTGIARNLLIGTIGSQTLNLMTNGATRWYVHNSNGDIRAATDGSSDIGTIATERPNNVYAKTSVNVGNGGLVANSNGSITSAAPFSVQTVAANPRMYFDSTAGGAGIWGLNRNPVTGVIDNSTKPAIQLLNLGGATNSFRFDIYNGAGTFLGTPLQIFGTSIDATNGLLIGSGTEITKHISVTFGLDFANLASIGCEDMNITTAIGAAVGDSVSLGVPNGSMVANGFFFAWVSAANTVTVRFCTLTSGDPATGSFRVDVWSH